VWLYAMPTSFCLFVLFVRLSPETRAAAGPVKNLTPGEIYAIVAVAYSWHA